MAIVWLTGFEHGALSTGGGGICNTLTGTSGTNISVQSTTKRTGTYALRVYPSAAAAHIGKTISQTVTVMRFYVRFATNPTGDHVIVRIMTATQQALFGYSYNGGSPRFYATVNSGTPQYTASNSVTTGVWYLVDLLFDTSTGTSFIDWQIDGVKKTRATRTVSTANQTVLNIGVTTSATADFCVDDVIVSNSSSDYPFRDGYIKGYVPGSDGTHNDGSNYIQNELGNPVSGHTAYDHCNNMPMSGASKYIMQTDADTEAYAEVYFSQFSETLKKVRHVWALVAYRSASTTANNAACRIIGTAEDTIYSGDMSETTVQYKGVIVTPPTAGWDTDSVNALKARMGFASDATPDAWWTGFLIEVHYTDEANEIVACTTF